MHKVREDKYATNNQIEAVPNRPRLSRYFQLRKHTFCINSPQGTAGEHCKAPTRL